ncbi:putative N-acetylmannosamine-6-phosphate 2-epimerase [Jiangella aurantiaca]|uniref:N-acylglucosamine-6-phosphate 2-epimerase n=1 Tax=Jiangella aurantiaca TaxID=2530373 RepID=A0A4R5ADN7_9ACTN|nr:putative N-acetylmannosamine-6-phosphate 2-epimerase [Jiangella aurantiaca]TDD70411.1 putative N-acetylmannosamine-6-phosphate 2-epimerase [Jiangella aurantiaca]
MSDAVFPLRSIVVSCQAGPDNPLHGPGPMALMARAAEAGGAAGIRANGPADVAAISAAVSVPVLGINKTSDRDGVYITPTFETAAAVVKAGATVVALDGTARPRPDGGSLADLVAEIHDRLGVPVMADVDTLDAGRYARAAGADLVGSTLSGYTASGGPGDDGPDLALVKALAGELDCPVVAEGRYWTRDDVLAAFDAGAHTVVVGTAVTNPMAITRRLVEAVR